jgi:putative addiction module component (TIGR02574 family)
MSNYDSLLQEAANLPLPDRIQLIEALWDTLPENEQPPLSAEWLSEIEKRSAEYDAGKVESIPWETIKTAAINRLSERNG